MKAISPARDGAAERVSEGTPAQGRGVRLLAHLASPLHRTGYALLSGSAITSVLGFVYWIVAARYYTPEALGLNAAVLSAMLLVAGASQLGLGAVLIRFVPTAGRSTRRLVLGSYLLSGSVGLLGGIGAAVTSGLWAPELDFLASSPGWLWGFALAVAGCCLFSLQDSVMTGLRGAGWVSLENGVVSVMKVALAITLVGLAPGAGIFVSWVAPFALALVLTNLLIFRRLLPRHVLRTGPVAESIRLPRIVHFVVGNYVGSLALLASTALLPIVVTTQLGARETAYFFVPWTIALALQLVAINLTISLTVEAALDESRLHEYCRRITLTMGAILIPVVVIILGFAPGILSAFGPEYAREGGSLLRLLALGMLPNAIVMLGIAVARVQQRSQLVAGTQLALAALVLPASYALLPVMGIAGVGLAWSVSQGVVGLVLTLGLLWPLFFSARPMSDARGAPRARLPRRARGQRT